MEGGCSVETTLLVPSNCPLDPLEPGEIGYFRLSYVYFWRYLKSFLLCGIFLFILPQSVF